MTARTCLDCPKSITPKSKTGRCVACSAKARWADPAHRAAHRAGAKRGAAKRLANPAEAERLRAVMLANRRTDPDVIARANASRDRTVMGWCPPEHRELNRHLRARGVLLPERKALIAEQVAIEERRAAAAEAARMAALSPLERQLAKVRAGARIVEVRPMRRADYAFTLGGVATGAL